MAAVVVVEAYGFLSARAELDTMANSPSAAPAAAIQLFFAVLVMAIVLYHINREFDHLDADRLSVLRG